LLFFGEKEAGHVQDLCSTQKKGKEKEEISKVTRYFITYGYFLPEGKIKVFCSSFDFINLCTRSLIFAGWGHLYFVPAFHILPVNHPYRK
jgi:hypothetical protein